MPAGWPAAEVALPRPNGASTTVMIVRQFLQWVEHAPAGYRAEATSALARAYLYSDLSEEDRAAAEGAMFILLDDPSPLVRRALAQAFASSEDAPPAIVHSLAGDQPNIAAPILERSPLLLDADLIDAVGSGDPVRQIAVASRTPLCCAVAAAIAEIGCAAACLGLLENPNAEIAPFSIDRIVARHGHLAPIRDALLPRDDISVSTRQALISSLADTLAAFVAARRWLSVERAQRICRDACDNATVRLAAESSEDDVMTLVRHLRESGQLTGGLMLRALLSGQVVLFEEALAELSGLPVSRVVGIVHDRRGASFRALYERASLPAAAYPAFRAALDAMQEEGFAGDPGGASRLKRRIVERVLTQCESAAIGEIDPLVTLLRRYASEAAREEARLFCEELVADDRFSIRAERRSAA